MASFTFLHAADLHLGPPSGSLALKDEEIAQRFALAGRRAFTDLVTQAIEMRAAFLVIAGDIYDREWRDATIGLFFAREMARLARVGIPVITVRGNHDAESVVTKAIGLPENVVEFPGDGAGSHRLDDLRVALHGRSFVDRAGPDESFARGYPEPLPGWFNIGVLHTSCGGHAAHATYAPCTPAELAARGYDYWALGHVHDYTEISRDPPIIFPGNLQGRSIRECGPKGAVAVDVVDGHVASIRRVIVDHARWAMVEADLSGTQDQDEAIAAIERAMRPYVGEAEGRLVAVRLRLSGATPLHDRIAGDRESLTAEAQAAAHRLHEDVWLEKLTIATTKPADAGAPGRSTLDPLGLLSELGGASDFRDAAAQIIAEITSKIPGGMTATDEPSLVDELEQLRAEAEAMVVTRLHGREC